MQPIFIVGSGRSGTTLVQSFVGAHPDVLTFPETNFIGHAFGDHMQRFYCKPAQMGLRQLLRTLRIESGIASRGARASYLTMLNNLGRKDYFHKFPRTPIQIKKAIRIWAETLSDITQESGKTAWLEKTPMNLGYTDEILEALPGAKIIHVIRDADATVASMLDASQKYAEWANYRDFDYCLRLWNRAIELSEAAVSKEQHFILHYEDLIAGRAQIISALFKFCQLRPIAFDEIELRRRRVANDISPKSEPWKSQVSGPVASVNKSNSVLSAAQREILTAAARPKPQASYRTPI